MPKYKELLIYVLKNDFKYLELWQSLVRTLLTFSCGTYDYLFIKKFYTCTCPLYYLGNPVCDSLSNDCLT